MAPQQRNYDNGHDSTAARGAGAETEAPGAFDDPRLLAAVQEYMTAVEAGRRPNRQEILARHPDIAPELSACLQGMAFLNSAAGGVSANDGAAINTGAEHVA